MSVPEGSQLVDDWGSISAEALGREVAQQFARHFGRPPRWVAVAPGRVNLIGEHVDYNDGFVMPMAIERYTVMAGDLAVPGRGNDQVRLHSLATGSSAEFPLSTASLRAEPVWANYVRGVMAGFLSRGVKLKGFDALVASTVPLGGGLSSSAALEVAAATLIEGMTGHALNSVDKALLCQKAEHDFAGVPCGIMDQFTSAAARENHLLLLDCRTRQMELLPMNDPELAILILNTNVRHELGSGAYAQRRRQCESAARALETPSLRDVTMDDLERSRPVMNDVEFRRARHVVTEIARTLEAAREIKAGRPRAVGPLMYRSHESLRDDFAVSCGELDTVVELAQEIGEAQGMYGCRMTGGGFGGCTVSLVRTEDIAHISQRLRDGYRARTGLEPILFLSRPAGGARLLP